MPFMPAKRFKDSGALLDAFAGEFLVRCPECDQVAVVSRRWNRDHRHWSAARLTCASCGHSRRSETSLHCVRCGIPQGTRWIGPVVLNARARCRRCGRWLEVRRKLKTPPRLPTIGLPCASCQVSTTAQYSLAHPPPTAAIDQCFGLPLVLQTACAGHTLWAYNPEHLAFLRAYLEADLREEHPTSHSSAASRLPRWLKLARHRAEALRAVARLERRLLTAR